MNKGQQLPLSLRLCRRSVLDLLSWLPGSCQDRSVAPDHELAWET